MHIMVVDKFGSRCITSQDGQALYNLIYPVLSNSEKVELDFTGVEIFASPFFNYSIGQIFNVLDEGVIRENLHLSGENEIGRIIIERVIENSLSFKDKNAILETISKVFDK